MIKLIFVGKTKGNNILSICNYYQKILKPFTKIKIIYIPQSKIAKKNNVLKVLEKEAKSIQNYIKKEDFTIALCSFGKSYNTIEFSKVLKEKIDYGKTINFIVGSSHGLSDQVLKNSNLHLSFSKFTFTHQLIRIFLFEQIYRCFTIIKNKPYHY